MNDIAERARYWANASVFDIATREEVAALLRAGAEQELRERFGGELEFGTGGMRGLVGAGTARLNIYNIRKASYALGKYLHTQFPDDTLQVAIAYDTRRHSRLFAETACMTLAALGIRTLLTEEPCPVPTLSFMVRHYCCQAGICVTASHNPPAYNGFKVYWQHGGQVVPPHDAGIIAEFNKINDYGNIALLPFRDAQRQQLLTMHDDSIDNLHSTGLESLARGTDAEVRAVYTPLHGTGARPVMRALARLGYHEVQIVAEQREADAEFSTVTSPNPEDPQAMRLAVQLAQASDAELVLATDPDCDRLGVMVQDGKEFRRVDGNQLLVLALEYVLATAHAAGTLQADDLVVRTIVTTELVEAIATHYGVQCETTLTGFKWIGQLMEDYETGKRLPYRRFLLGGEESFGLLYGRAVRDKDGIAACCLAMKMTAHFKTQGKGWFEVLDEIYLRHGVYHHDLLSLTLSGLDGKAKMEALLTKLRREPSCLARQPVQQVIDYRTGKVQGLPATNMLRVVLADGTQISVRPSGTEPKIKFYLALQRDVPDANALPHVKQACHAQAEQLKTTSTGLSRYLVGVPLYKRNYFLSY